MKSKGDFNLQNHGFTLQQSNVKEEEETYIIPSIIKKGYKQDYKAKNITTKKSEAEYFKEDCNVGM
jgi:hypothetical protein